MTGPLVSILSRCSVLSVKMVSGIVFPLFIVFMAPVYGQAPPPARGPCPAGAPFNGGCGSPANAGSNYSPSQPEIWKNRYGAIAKDEYGNTISTEDQPSESKAKRKVLKACGKGCELASVTRNSCQGIVSGAGRLFIGARPTAAETRSALLAMCAAEKRKVCDVVYEGCSLPVRVR